MTNYNFEDVKNVIHQIVAEKPDYKYEYPEGADECTYTDKDGNPSCLLGHAIFRLDPDELQRIHEAEWGWVERKPVDEDGNEIWYAEPVKTFQPVGIVGIEDLEWAKQFQPYEQRAMGMAQVAQDKGQIWREAGEKFDRTLDEAETAWEVR